MLIRNGEWVEFDELSNDRLRYLFKNSPVVKVLILELVKSDLYSSKNRTGPDTRAVKDITDLLPKRCKQKDYDKYVHKVKRIFKEVGRMERLAIRGITYCKKTNTVTTPGCVIHLDVQADWVPTLTHQQPPSKLTEITKMVSIMTQLGLGPKVTHAELIERFDRSHPLNFFIRTLIKFHLYQEKYEEHYNPIGRRSAYITGYLGEEWADENVCDFIDLCKHAFSEIEFKQQLMDVGINLIGLGRVLVTPEYVIHLTPETKLQDEKDDVQGVAEVIPDSIQKPKESTGGVMEQFGKRVTYAELNRRFGKTGDVCEIVGMLTRNKLYRNDTNPAQASGKRTPVDLNEYLNGLGAQYLINEFKNKCLDAFAVPARRARLNAVGIDLVEDDKVLLTPDYYIYIQFTMQTDDQTEEDVQEPKVKIMENEASRISTVDQPQDDKLKTSAKFVRELMERKASIQSVKNNQNRDVTINPYTNPHRFADDHSFSGSVMHLQDTVMSDVLSQISQYRGFAHALLEVGIVISDGVTNGQAEDTLYTATLASNGSVVTCSFECHGSGIYDLDLV